MAAADLTALASPLAMQRVTLEATATNAREIQLPSWARSVYVAFQSSAYADEAGRVSHEGTDGATLGANYMPVPAGAALTLPLNVGRSIGARSIYVAGSSASAYAFVTVMGQEA